MATKFLEGKTAGEEHRMIVDGFAVDYSFRELEHPERVGAIVTAWISQSIRLVQGSERNNSLSVTMTPDFAEELGKVLIAEAKKARKDAKRIGKENAELLARDESNSK
jgi:hypothetical protein